MTTALVAGTYTLGGAGPKNANLRGAGLRGADLTDTYVSKEQLDQANSLEGATMPDRSKHP